MFEAGVQEVRLNGHVLVLLWLILFDRLAKLFTDMGAKSILTVLTIQVPCAGLISYTGANLNAQIGLTNPAVCGGDVCHLNLHKTFAMYVPSHSCEPSPCID